MNIRAKEQDDEQQLCVASVSTNDVMHSIARPPLAFQKVSLDAAVAPALSRPIAPFAKSERKRAYTSAIYYSECFLRGIPPVHADTAALDVESKFKKWWVKSRYRHNSEENENDDMNPTVRVGDHRSRKRRRIEPSTSPKTKMETGESTATKTLEADSMYLHVLSEEESSLNQREPESSQRGGSSAGDTGPGQGRTNGESTGIVPIKSISCFPELSFKDIVNVKMKLIENLRDSGGDTDNSRFRGYLDTLHSYYCSRGWDARCMDGRSDSKNLPPSPLDGKWLTLSKPNFSECNGRNDKGENMYTLGRMSFDMFRPSKLLCSVRGIYNNISLMDTSNNRRPSSFPRKLAKQVCSEETEIRHYDIVVAFTIQGDQTRGGTTVDSDFTGDEFVLRRPIHGSMTNHGYLVPDPDVPNRLTVWFSGGKLHVDEPVTDLETWKQLFDADAAPRRDILAMAHVLAAKLLIGAHIPHDMNEDGSMKYQLKRPIGGHGQVFCDVLYTDETLRIMKGHQGTIFVLNRVSSIDTD